MGVLTGSRELIFDLECTFSYRDKMVKGKPKPVSDYASPFNDNNRIVCMGMYAEDLGYKLFDFDRGDKIEDAFAIFDDYNLLVGHNVKYDVHWLRSVGYDTRKHILIDTLITEYVINGGKLTYGQLGLDKLAPEYGGTNKIDIIKKQWNAGINTDEITKYVLHEYLYYDVLNTWKIRQGQKEKLNVQ